MSAAATAFWERSRTSPMGVISPPTPAAVNSRASTDVFGEESFAGLFTFCLLGGSPAQRRKSQCSLA